MVTKATYCRMSVKPWWTSWRSYNENKRRGKGGELRETRVSRVTSALEPSHIRAEARQTLLVNEVDHTMSPAYKFHYVGAADSWSSFAPI